MRFADLMGSGSESPDPEPTPTSDPATTGPAAIIETALAGTAFSQVAAPPPASSESAAAATDAVATIVADLAPPSDDLLPHRR